MEKKQLVDPSKPFSYESGQVPETYVCGKCGNSNVKLWRDYQTFLEHQKLRCAKCITKEHAKKGEKRQFRKNSDGNNRWSNPQGFPESDQIGWRVPAVPTEDNTTFWGYTSVPPEGCIWWDNLDNGV